MRLLPSSEYILITVFVVGIVTAALGTVVATDTTSAATDTTVTVERTIDGLQYELSLSPDGPVEGLWVFVEDGRVVETEGFERSDDGPRTRLTWTGASTARIVVAVDVPRRAPSSGRETVRGDGWTFGTVPFVEVQRAVDGRIERTWPFRGATGVLADGEGTAGDRFVLVGETESATRSTVHGTIRVVAPAGTDPDVPADVLAAAAGRLDVGDRDESVLAFAVPGVRGGGQAVPARDEFWVNAHESPREPASVWLHEYVHTRQSFDLAEDMGWFREASAEYYAARLSNELGYADGESVYTELSRGPTGTLTRPATWEGSQVPHTRGARVLAALDSKIRLATDGQRSLADVFRRLNRLDGPVDYDRFAGVTSDVAGRPMDGWLAHYVDGEAPVAASAGTDSPADPLEVTVHRPTPASFVGVSVGLSLVAAVPLLGLLRRLDGNRGGVSGAAPAGGEGVSRQ